MKICHNAKLNSFNPDYLSQNSQISRSFIFMLLFLWHKYLGHRLYHLIILFLLLIFLVSYFLIKHWDFLYLIVKYINFLSYFQVVYPLSLSCFMWQIICFFLELLAIGAIYICKKFSQHLVMLIAKSQS